MKGRHHLLINILALFLFAMPLPAATLYLLTADGKLAITTTANPSGNTTPLTITGVTAGETLVGIDVRPQNQQLYALGVNATTDTATLYHLAPENGIATVVGTASSVALTTNGVTAIDLPEPTTTPWDIDFNPAADRLRVVAGSLTFRVDPNFGVAVDGNNGGGVSAGVNPDGAINGGATSIGAAAYTNNQPNQGGITTLYTLDPATNSLFIQNPPNSGTQGGALPILLGGSPLDFTVQGFDIPENVNASASNVAVSAGFGFAVLTVGGTPSLYSINLVNGSATLIGTVPACRGMAIYTEVPTALALSSDGTNLVRFNPTTPGTTTTQFLSNYAAGESLVGLDFRPATGQLYTLGINEAANTGTLYLLDPQTGVASPIGTTGQIAFTTNGTTPVDFPDPATSSYTLDFNPTVDRLRVITSTGLNFRLNPFTGAAVDGDRGGAAGSVTGTNPDGALNGANGTAGSGAYTNSFAGATVTTLYTLDAISHTLCIQNPPNAGTQNIAQTITISGSPLNFSLSGDCFDIPSGVTTSSSNTPAPGDGWALLTVNGTTGVYQIDLLSGRAIYYGATSAPYRGFTVPFVPAEIAVAVSGAAVFDGADTVEFGETLAGQPTFQLLVLRNAGNGYLNYTSSLSTGSAYQITANGSGTLAPGKSVQLEVTFTPPAAGTVTDTLHLLSNDASEASFDLDLTGDSLLQLNNDAITITSGDSRLFVLANDGLSPTAKILSVDDGSISIDAAGRALIIPAGYTGAFSYTTDDNGLKGRGNVTVTAGTPVTGAKTYSDLLRTDIGLIAGSASGTLSAKGAATVLLRAGIARATAKFTLPQPGSFSAALTSLGYAFATRKADGTIELTILANGGNLHAVLRPSPLNVTAGKHHIALASTDSQFLGGGTAIAMVGKTGAIKITGTLVDGLPFTATSSLRDDGSFVFFTNVTGAKPAALLGGQFQTANLPATDVTGELSYQKFVQLSTAKGTEKSGIDTYLTANGCLFDGNALLPAGNATLTLAGGNLGATEINPVTISTKGIPTLTGSLKSWTGVAQKVGKFNVTVQIPGTTKLVKGSGLYLPKNQTAWGYFPGTTKGGGIQVTVP